MMRCVLKEVTLERKRSDISTIGDEESVSEAGGAWQALRTARAGVAGRPVRYKRETRDTREIRGGI
jgi:hypothetical protein